MRKELIYEKEVGASADSVWEVYSAPNISTLLEEVLLPGVFERLDILEGDGASVGTILLLEFRNPATIPHTFLEKYTKLDHQKRLMEVEVIQGGYMELGCTFYLNKIQILEKSRNSCGIKSTLIFDAPEELMEYVSQYANLESLISMAEVISKYVLQQQFRVFGIVVKKPKLGAQGSSTLLMLCTFIFLVIVFGGGLWIGMSSCSALSSFWSLYSAGVFGLECQVFESRRTRIYLIDRTAR